MKNIYSNVLFKYFYKIYLSRKDEINFLLFCPL